MKSVNFEFLREANEPLANLGGLAEAVLHIDPGSSLTRLRNFAEELTKVIYQEELLPRMLQSSFYELMKSPVFTSVSHEGTDGVFTADDVGELITVLRPFLKQEGAHEQQSSYTE